MARNSILVIDDVSENVKLIRIALTREGYDIRTAYDAEQALAILQSFKPDLILLDIQLPGMSGVELSRQLKSDPSTQDIKIIAFSAYATKRDEEEMLAAECDGYISKPVDTNTLVEAIEKFLKS